MLVSKRMRGLSTWALLLSVVFYLALSSVSTSHAQVPGSTAKTADTLEDGGTRNGDPDMPTGDTPPASGGSVSSGGNEGGGIVLHSSTAPVEPSKRFGAWAHWKIALKLFARGLWLR